nr:glutamate receptor ionotropic, kainate 5-like [Anolis sagrei ordinatus]
MENIGGIFVVLICGLIIAVFVAVMEFVWATRRSAEHEEISVCQEMLRELRHAVSCRKPSRARRRPRRHHHHHHHLGPGSSLSSSSSRGGPLSLRAVREMRLSNGKLYSGSLASDPGPQRLLEETPPPGGPPRPCAHVRICHECRRIQTLRGGAPQTPRGTPLLPPPPPPHEEGSPRPGRKGGGASAGGGGSGAGGGGAE